MKTKRKHWPVLTASTLGLTGLASAANLGGEKYTYDGSGNIIEKTIDGQVTKMSYDDSNKVTSIDSANKGRERIYYDAAGRPLSYKDSSGQPTRQLSYGYADKVMQANTSSGKADFFYNAEGQLVAKSVAGKLVTYAWDSNVLAAEGAEAFTNESHFTGGVPAITGDQSVVVSDHLGNTLSQGVQQFTSTAYGEGLETGRFTGKPYVKEIGGYVFLHRIYDQKFSRWNMADPVGFPDGENRFSYLSDPHSGVDPMGTTVKLWIKGSPKSSHYVSIDGDGDVYGIYRWNYLLSWTYYGGNVAHGTDGGLDYKIYADGQYFNTVSFEVNQKIEVFEDMATHLLDKHATLSDHECTSPCVAGVKSDITGMGTKTLRIDSSGIVGHNATSILGAGINSGVSLSLTGTSTANTKSYSLGTWVWKES